MNRNISTISLFSIILTLLLGGWFVLYMYNRGVNIAVNDNENRDAVNNDDRNSLVQEENKEIVSENPIDSHVDAVDISDWKIYQDDAVSFKYPPQYEINAKGIQDGFVVFGTKDRLRTTFLSEGKEEISETGFVLSVNIVKLSESYINAMGEKNRDSQWRNWVGRDRGGLGNAVFQNVSYKGKEIIMIEDTGTGSIYANEQISQNYNIPNDTKNIIAEVNLLTNKNEFSQFENIILGVIQTFQFD